MKPCFRCGERERRENGGAYCLSCSSLNMKEWRAKNPERNRAIGKRSDQKRWSANVAKFTEKRRLRNMRWRTKNPEEYTRQSREKYQRARERAIVRLGSKCVCCGSDYLTMLDIDHIYNNGSVERAGKSYSNLHRKVLAAENPHKEYQLLCASCNHSKARNYGLCEHYTRKWLAWGDEPDPGPYPFAPANSPPHDIKRVVASWMSTRRRA